MKRVALENLKVRGVRTVGALSGVNKGRISKSYAEGEVYAESPTAGGLVGKNEGEISESYFRGRVKSGRWSAGGLVGDNDHNSAEVKNCYALARVIGERRTGGLVGTNGSASCTHRSGGTIENSYSVAVISGGKGIATKGGGGFGGPGGGEIIRSYYNAEVCGTAGENVLGIPKASKQMTEQETFEKWNFENIWTMDEGKTYPYFQWQQTNIPDVLTGYDYSRGGPKAVECFYDKEAANLKENRAEGTPKTTDEMMRRETFEGWDFENVWAIEEGESYPYLRWVYNNFPPERKKETDNPVAKSPVRDGLQLKISMEPEGTVNDVNSATVQYVDWIG